MRSALLSRQGCLKQAGYSCSKPHSPQLASAATHLDTMALSLARSAQAVRPATRSAVRVAPSRRVAVTVRAGSAYPSDWIKRDPLVPVLGFLGWTIPSNIPVSAFGGQSLFGLFTQQIGAELAHFPTGPSIDSPFWLYMITWHMGLFACIFWGQIGVQARKQGYLN